MTLFRPVNQAELDLIIQNDWKAFPPRLVGQPIFYPVLNEAYAEPVSYTHLTLPTICSV